MQGQGQQQLPDLSLLFLWGLVAGLDQGMFQSVSELPGAHSPSARLLHVGLSLAVLCSLHGQLDLAASDFQNPDTLHCTHTMQLA